MKVILNGGGGHVQVKWVEKQRHKINIWIWATRIDKKEKQVLLPITYSIVQSDPT